MPGYRFEIDVFKDEGARLGRMPLLVDWLPAREWAWFNGVRRGELPASLSLSNATVTVQPAWNASLGQPYISGFELRVWSHGSGGTTSRFTTAYFHGLAEQISTELVEQGLLKPNELFRFVISAHEDSQSAPHDDQGGPFKVVSVEPPLSMRETAIDGFLERAVAFTPLDDVEMPVFVPWPVLQEAAALTRRAGALETGGILIGHLHHDGRLPEVFAEITAQIPAHHAQSGLAKLTFTPDTWAAVHAAIALRNKGESYLGWWHSHSFLKETCKEPAQRRAGLKLSASFFSPEDLHLQRTVFSRAFHVALVAADSPCSGLTWSAYGWRAGMISLRSYHILGLGN